MDRKALINALSVTLPSVLAEELVDAFIEIRRDVATSTLGRGSPGKFVESVVQALQHLATGSYDSKPNVDGFLRKMESSPPPPDDGLRICGSRIARAMYALRSKRNIVHKGDVDPNVYDLKFLLAGAQWTLAELVRVGSGLPMHEAGTLVAAITAPVGGLVEDFGGKRLVHGDLSLKDEILVFVHSYHPEALTPKTISDGLDRRASGTVRKELRVLWRDKLLQGDGKSGYQLTRTGLEVAVEVIGRELGDADIGQ